MNCLFSNTHSRRFSRRTKLLIIVVVLSSFRFLLWENLYRWQYGYGSSGTGVDWKTLIVWTKTNAPLSWWPARLTSHRPRRSDRPSSKIPGRVPIQASRQTNKDSNEDSNEGCNEACRQIKRCPQARSKNQNPPFNQFRWIGQEAESGGPS